MPDVTLPPALVDSSPQESAQLNVLPIGLHDAFFKGPFVANNALYVVLLTTDGSALVVVFKSVDGGATWAQQDAANSPAYTGICRMTARLNPDGHTITISYNTTSVAPITLSWITFSALTDTFTAGSIPDLTVAGLGMEDCDWVVRSTGLDILIVYPLVVAPNVSEADLGFSVLSAGVWSAFSSFAAGDDATQVGWSIPSLLYDAGSGITYGFVQRQQLITGVAFAADYAYQITAGPGNVPSVPVAISPSVANYRPSYGRPVFWQNQVALAAYDTPLGANTFTMRVYLGGPLPAPVFTFTDIDSGATTNFTDLAVGQLAVDGTTLWALWLNWPDHATIQIRRSINTGAGWGAINLFYDLATNPPNALAIGSQGLFAFSAAQIASLGVLFTVRDAAGTKPLAYFLRSAAAPPATPTTNIVLGLKGMKVYPQAT